MKFNVLEFDADIKNRIFYTLNIYIYIYEIYMKFNVLEFDADIKNRIFYIFYILI